jgi:tetratricopeptide (TPR) repeat protein
MSITKADLAKDHIKDGDALRLIAPADALRAYVSAAQHFLPAEQFVQAARAYDSAAKCALALHDTHEAIRLFTLSIQASPHAGNIIDRHLQLAKLFESVGDISSAIQRYNAAFHVATFENHREHIVQLGRKIARLKMRLSPPESVDATNMLLECAALAHKLPSVRVADYLLDAVLTGLQCPRSLPSLSLPLPLPSGASQEAILTAAFEAAKAPLMWTRVIAVDPGFAHTREGALAVALIAAKTFENVDRAVKVMSAVMSIDEWRMNQIRALRFV